MSHIYNRADQAWNTENHERDNHSNPGLAAVFFEAYSAGS